MGPLDPEAKHNLGGVGVMYNHCRKTIKVRPKTQNFLKATQTGRCEHYAIDIGRSNAVSFYNLYGWTGGHQNKKQASRTNKVVEAIEEEILHQPDGPACICGDLNAEPQDIKAVKEMSEQDGWIDAGARADIWGQPTWSTPAYHRPRRSQHEGTLSWSTHKPSASSLASR